MRTSKQYTYHSSMSCSSSYVHPLALQVAAGMSRSLVVEIFAMAVGVVGECGVGSVQHEVEIVSEATVMYLPVKANIL